MIVTHNMQQAARCSDYTAYMYLGDLIEFGRDPGRLHAAEEEGHRGLHHRPLRLRPRPQDSTMSDNHLSTQFDAELSGISTRVLEMGGMVESQVARAVYALDQLQRRDRRRGAGDRGARQPDRGRDRPRPVDHHRPAPADRARPAPPDRDLEDDRQPRARRRRGGAHRAHRAAAGQLGRVEPAAPAGQRPRLRGRARRLAAAQGARRVRAARRRPRRRGAQAATTRSTRSSTA